MSHELDLATHLFGKVLNHVGMATRAADVTVDSEDVAAFLLRHQSCPLVSLQMNYLDWQPRREWLINTSRESIRVDLLAGSITTNGALVTVACAGDDAYRLMHQAWLTNSMEHLCGYEDAVELVRIMDGVTVA